MFKVEENPDLATIMKLLRKSSWALDQPFKTIEIGDKEIRITKLGDIWKGNIAWEFAPKIAK
jgi:hypothetical protein